MANKGNLVNPNARDAMDRFKMEAAGEVGVSLKQGYNGELTSRQAGSVGGQMVKNVTTARRTRNVSFQRENRVVDGHKMTVRYIASLCA